jgi:DNA-binding MarR family transcriptional regulator
VLPKVRGMKRGEAGKHQRTHGRWMRPSERLVFFVLLDRADNSDCTIPAFMTPSLPQLAEAIGYSPSAAAEALSHLEKHGWLERSRSKGGRGRKSKYRLDAGGACDAASPTACLRPPKQSDGSDGLPEKQSDGSDQKQSDESCSNPRSDPVPDEGHRRGRVDRGEPDWSLYRQIIRIVHADPRGGLHRDELAEKCGVPPRGKAIGQALAITYRRGHIDYCGQYVVKVIPKEQWPA